MSKASIMRGGGPKDDSAWAKWRARRDKAIANPRRSPALKLKARRLAQEAKNAAGK